PPFGVQVDELQGIPERQIRQLARRVLSQPQRPSLDRATEADVGVGLRGQERMFSWTQVTSASTITPCTAVLSLPASLACYLRRTRPDRLRLNLDPMHLRRPCAATWRRCAGGPRSHRSERRRSLRTFLSGWRQEIRRISAR